MQTKKELGKLKEINLVNRALRASFASLGVFILGFCLVPTLASEASATMEVGAKVNWTSVSLTLDPDSTNPSPTSSDYGDVLFNDIIPTSAGSGNIGTEQVIKKTIAVTTSGTSYSVFLSLASDTADLVRSGSGTTASINSVAGTWSSPVAFTSTSWGYSVPGSPIDGANFSSASVYAGYDSFLTQNLTKSGIGSSVYNTGTWAAAPASTTSPQQIWKNETSSISGFSSGDTFDIYYAVMVDNNVLSGSYENELVYTAFASSTSLDTVSNNIARSLRYGTGGDTETLELELTMNIPSLTKDQVEVYLVPHKVTEQNKDTETGSYTATGLGAYNDDTNGDTYKCIIGSAVSDFVLDSNTGTLTLNCTIPENPDTTIDPANVNFGGLSMRGEWDFWVQIEDYGLNYVSQYTENTEEVASFIYAGLQTRKRNETDFVISREMQAMTPAICKNIQPYTVYGLTYQLTDTRDQNTYYVRKIGDYCWMVQNLRFVGTSLNPTTTDINTSKTISYEDYTYGASYSVPMVHSGPISTSYGGDGTTTYVWYNYAAATAATITDSKDTNKAENSLCPKNWTMPTMAEALTLSSNFNLFYAQSTDGFGRYFPTTTEHSEGSTLAYHTPSSAWWWTTDSYSNTHRRLLRDGGRTDYDPRYIMLFVRCVARDQQLNNRQGLLAA